LDSNKNKGYEYPSGKGETSPIVGKVLAGRPARGAGTQGLTKFDAKANGSIKVGSETMVSYSEKGSFSDPKR